MEIEFGAPGTIMPPADKAVEFAQRAEADGYDVDLVAEPPDGLAPRVGVDGGHHPARHASSRTRTPTSTRS